MITEDDRPKPAELLELFESSSVAFSIVKEEFQVPDTYALALHDIDAATPLLTETRDIAAITMRKIQALRWVATPGVETANDVVVTLAADLHRALDYLARCCTDQHAADALTTFKHQVVVAARRASTDSGITALR